MIVEIFIGFVLGFIIVWVGLISWATYKSIKPFDVDEEALIDGLYDEARCPDCGCKDLKLVDRYKGVEWMRGGDDGDHYECLECGRSFSDEEWADVKSTNVDLGGMQD